MRSDVRTLAVELRGVVHDGEKDAQQGAEADDGGVVDDFDGFGVAGVHGRDGAIDGRGFVAAGVTDGCLDDSLDALEDGLRAPEAASGEDGGVEFAGFPAAFRCVDVVGWSGDWFLARVSDCHTPPESHGEDGEEHRCDEDQRDGLQPAVRVHR